jgi:hypothetical protein
MYRRLSRAAHRENGNDAGIGMIMVIGIAGIVTVLIGVLLTDTVNGLSGSTRHQHFDLALTGAESGIDQALSRTQSAYVAAGATYLSPNTSSDYDPDPTCKGNPIDSAAASPHGFPGAPWSTADAERDWALDEITSMVQAHPDCLQHSQNSDFASIAPSGVQAVYSVGWAPSYSDPSARRRLVKAEYLFVPYAPTNAVLTGGNLLVASSTTINTPDDVDPCLAQVHSNGTVSIQGNPTIQGQVSSTVASSGSYKLGDCKDASKNSGAVINSPEQDIPAVSARQVYLRNATANANNWYDLCPNGDVRSPGSSGPCTGTLLADASTTANAGFRHWTFVTSNWSSDPGAAMWQGQKGGIEDGIYYVHDGDVTQAQANPHTNAATIIAEATVSGPGRCPKIGGNIQWGKNDIGAPALPGLFMLADADLSTDSNFHAGTATSSGLFIAGDQVDLETSSQGAYGGVIAADQCNTGGIGVESDVVKNPTVTYVPNAVAPFTSTIDTSLWLEYPGSQ